MNGILGQQVAERTALFRGGAGPGRSTPKQTSPSYPQNSGGAATATTPAAVHRVHSAPTKRPEPVCILGCCGFGKISILWTVSEPAHRGHHRSRSRILLTLCVVVFFFADISLI